MTTISRSLALAGVLGGALLWSLVPAHAQVAPAVPANTAATAPTTSWTTFKGNTQRTGATAANLPLPLSLQWRFSSTGPARTSVTAPLVIGAPGRQRVIFASGGNVYALDAATGTQVWKSPDTTSTYSVPIALLSTDAGDLILAMQSSGRLDAFKSADGGRAWQIDVGGLVTEAGPIVAETDKGPRVVCAINNGRLIAIDEKGKIDPDWRLKLGNVGNSAASSMSLSEDGSRLFILGSDSRLYIINVREARTLYSLQQASRSGVTPVAWKDTVFTANARRVAAWRIGDGSPSWTVTPQGDVVGSPALQSDAQGGTATLFFGTREGQFQAIDAASGNVKWKRDLGKFINFTGSPLALRDAVVVGTSDGILMGFNPADGATAWQYRLQTERVFDLKPRPATARNTGTDGGGGFDGGAAPADGTAPTQELRTYGVSSAPSAIDSKMFVQGDDAAIYAFTSQPFDADPPRIVEPSIAVNATDRELLSLLLTPDNSQIVPGVGPFYFAAQIDDVGSGVDPTSIKVSIDDTPLDSKRVFFGIGTGVLTVTLVDTTKGDPSLADGLKKITIQINDYAGNQTEFSTNFLVDNTASAPAPPVDTTVPIGGPEGGGGFQP